MSIQKSNYYKNRRKTLSQKVENGSNVVLDVGCGAGFFGESLKKNGKADYVYGIEIDHNAANEASSKLDNVICADLDTLNFNDLRSKWNFPPHYDYIVFADVLEHVKDPWRVLKTATNMLNKNGRIIISIPNVRHWSVIFPLLFRGQWNYKDEGIMDRTHLRFFTKKTAIELVKSAGLKLNLIEPQIGGKSLYLAKGTFHSLDDFLAIQYHIIAFKSDLSKTF